jgi:hypothetical protein
MLARDRVATTVALIALLVVGSSLGVVRSEVKCPHTEPVYGRCKLPKDSGQNIVINGIVPPSTLCVPTSGGDCINYVLIHDYSVPMDCTPPWTPESGKPDPGPFAGA